MNSEAAAQQPMWAPQNSSSHDRPEGHAYGRRRDSRRRSRRAQLSATAARAQRPGVAAEGLGGDASTLYGRTAADGSSVGNTNLRRQLHWDEARYWPARDELIEAALVQRGRGRGGGVRRVNDLIDAPTATAVAEW